MEKFTRLGAFGLSALLTFCTTPNPSPDWRSAASFLAGALLMWALRPSRSTATPN